MKRKFPNTTIQTSLREIDLSEFDPIVNHEYFICLGEKTQLSFVDKVYVGGRHSRLEHSCFVYHFTTELCRSLVERGFLSPEKARHIRGASLVHDLGHPPFSHAIDELLSHLDVESRENHHTRTQKLVKELSEEFGSIGLDSEEIASIVAKKDETSPIISHNTLGTDKLGYLLLDSHHTGYTFQLPFILDIFPYYYYSPDSLGVEEAKRPQIESIQRVIQDMYRDVYLHQDVLQYSRFIQKAVESAINGGELSIREIWNMPEGALLYRLLQSKIPSVRQQMTRYMKNMIQYPVAVVKCRGDGRNSIISPEAMNRVAEAAENPCNLTELEQHFSDAFSLDSHTTYMTVSSHSRRILPENVDLYDRNGTKIASLFEAYPSHFTNLSERAQDFLALRIYAAHADNFPDTEQIKDFIKQYIDT